MSTDARRSKRPTTAEMRRALFCPSPTADDAFEDDPTTFDNIPIFGADAPVSDEMDPDDTFPSDVGAVPPEVARAAARPPSTSRGLWLGLATACLATLMLLGVATVGFAVGGAAVAWSLMGDTPGHATITGAP